MTDEEKMLIFARVDAALMERIKSWCKRDRASVAMLIRVAVREFLDREDSKCAGKD